jgi:hypothetical protein
VAAAAIFFAGCGETVIDAAKTEAAIEHDLQESTGKEISSVDCPDGVEVEPRATFECEITLAGGNREIVSLKILNDDADVAVTDLTPEKAEKEE